MENKHTYIEYKFANGETIKCTVAFKFLLKLREYNKKLYEKINDGLLNGVSELVEAPFILYGAYICACFAGENGGIDNAMTEDDFIEALDDDLVNVMLTCTQFINKKKN